MSCSTELECLQIVSDQILSIMDGGGFSAVANEVVSISDRLGLVETANGSLEKTVWLLTTCGVLLAFIWGAITWKLLVYAKNHKTLWGLAVFACLSWGAADVRAQVCNYTRVRIDGGGTELEAVEGCWWLPDSGDGYGYGPIVSAGGHTYQVIFGWDPYNQFWVCNVKRDGNWWALDACLDPGGGCSQEHPLGEYQWNWPWGAHSYAAEGSCTIISHGGPDPLGYWAPNCWLGFPYTVAVLPAVVAVPTGVYYFMRWWRARNAA